MINKDYTKTRYTEKNEPLVFSILVGLVMAGIILLVTFLLGVWSIDLSCMEVVGGECIK